MTLEDLRKLADQRKWHVSDRVLEEYHGRYEVIDEDGGYVCLAEVQEQARLIALAPDLARLCAEMTEALEDTRGYLAELRGDWPRSSAGERVRAALAQLADLEVRG